MQRIRLAASAGSLALLFLSCAGNRPPCLTDAHPFPERVSEGALRFKGFGDVGISTSGEKHRGTIHISQEGSTAFSCEVFDAFGGSVVSIVADAESAHVAVGEQRYDMACGDRLAAVPYFGRYPFTFEQLKRILTGRTPFAGIATAQADTTWGEGRYCRRQWTRADTTVTAREHGRSGRLEEVMVRGGGQNLWSLSLRRFKDGTAREIEFETEGRNYFVLRFQRVEETLRE